MDKAKQPSQKGFVLVDVRSPEEHQGGFIPGTDFNIDFRDIQNRHQELHAEVRQPHCGVLPIWPSQQYRSRNADEFRAIRMSTMWKAV